MHTLVSAVQLVGRPDKWTPEMVYIGMPGNAARGYGITEVGPFGKPWDLLNDPRGWQEAYREYLWNRMRSDGDFALAVADLHGKTLLCWCKAKVAGTRRKNGEIREEIPPCHGDILAKAVEWLYHGIESYCSLCFTIHPREDGCP